MIENICSICSTKFFRPKNPNRIFKYCSTSCMGKDNEKSKKHSELMKGRTAWNKGHKGLKDWMNLSGLNKGIPWNRGKSGAQEAWNKGIQNIHFIGEKNPNWKGGVTKLNDKIRKSIEYKKWRTSVFERDKYTCVICGDNNGGNLEADHIKQFAYYHDLRFDLNNGRTLCNDCHRKTDTYLNNGRWKCNCVTKTI